MINQHRLKLLLDNTFIHYASDCYQWALDSEAELNHLPETKRKRVTTYHRGVDYKEKATLLVNQAFKERIEEHGLGGVTTDDLERAWYLRRRVTPRDPVGLIYGWLVSHVMMYIPDRRGKKIKELLANEVVDGLFKDFINWCETNGEMNTLIVLPGSPTYIDETRGMFELIVTTVMDTNSYVGQLIKQRRANLHFDRRKEDLYVENDRRRGIERRRSQG